MDKKMLRAYEACQQIGVCIHTVYMAIKAGTIKALFQDGVYLIPQEEVDKYIVSSKKGVGLEGHWTVKELAKMGKCPNIVIYNRIYSGEIPSIRIGRKIFVPFNKQVEKLVKKLANKKSWLPRIVSSFC